MSLDYLYTIEFYEQIICVILYKLLYHSYINFDHFKTMALTFIYVGPSIFCFPFKLLKILDCIVEI